MKTVCAWCTAVIEEGEGPQVSHGLCQPCRMSMAVRDQVSLQRFLNAFDFPVIVLNESLKPVAVNRSGSSLCKQVEADSTIGGVIECAHSRLPGGCGNTVHCSGCVIRNTLNETTKTGRAFSRVPARLTTTEEVSLLVSTIKTDMSAVLLKLEKVWSGSSEDCNLPLPSPSGAK